MARNSGVLECVPLEPKANFEKFPGCRARTDKSPRGRSRAEQPGSTRKGCSNKHVCVCVCKLSAKCEKIKTDMMIYQLKIFSSLYFFSECCVMSTCGLNPWFFSFRFLTLYIQWAVVARWLRKLRKILGLNPQVATESTVPTYSSPGACAVHFSNG